MYFILRDRPIKQKRQSNIMDKYLIKGIVIILIGLTPVILFASSYSTEVWRDSNWSDDDQGQEDFTIPNPNPLLGDRYMLIVGRSFSSFQGYIEGNVTIMSKATMENQTFQIYIDATTPYWSWSSDHHVVILPPGEYTIFWQLTPFNPGMYIYSHGWFITEHDEPREVNGIQTLITMVSGFVAFIIAMFVIPSVVRRRKLSKNVYRVKENLSGSFKSYIKSPDVMKEFTSGQIQEDSYNLRPKFCTNCGTKVPIEAKFCQNCRAHLDQLT